MAVLVAAVLGLGLGLVPAGAIANGSAGPDIRATVADQLTAALTRNGAWIARSPTLAACSGFTLRANVEGVGGEPSNEQDARALVLALREAVVIVVATAGAGHRHAFAAALIAGQLPAALRGSVAGRSLAQAGAARAGGRFTLRADRGPGSHIVAKEADAIVLALLGAVGVVVAEAGAGDSHAIICGGIANAAIARGLTTQTLIAETQAGLGLARARLPFAANKHAGAPGQRLTIAVLETGAAAQHRLAPVRVQVADAIRRV